jgi:thioredoxin-dependent peroxiredoxin
VKTISEGATAPDFALSDQNGKTVSLSERLAEGPVVLFFYPAAMTPGCTKEACHFRDLATEFKEVGAQRLGISTDPVKRQQAFSEQQVLDYPLLSDEDGAVATSYGVKRRMITPVKRATFVIDTDRTIKKIITSELNMNVHADEALAALKGL